MPANLTPEYKAAEAEYRQARTPEARLSLLREMLRTIPKHKGTEHLRGDIKTRIKDLTQEFAAPRNPPPVCRAAGRHHRGPGRHTHICDLRWHRPERDRLKELYQ